MYNNEERARAFTNGVGIIGAFFHFKSEIFLTVVKEKINNLNFCYLSQDTIGKDAHVFCGLNLTLSHTK